MRRRRPRRQPGHRPHALRPPHPPGEEPRRQEYAREGLRLPDEGGRARPAGVHASLVPPAPQDVGHRRPVPRVRRPGRPHRDQPGRHVQRRRPQERRHADVQLDLVEPPGGRGPGGAVRVRPRGRPDLHQGEGRRRQVEAGRRRGGIEDREPEGDVELHQRVRRGAGERRRQDRLGHVPSTDFCPVADTPNPTDAPVSASPTSAAPVTSAPTITTSPSLSPTVTSSPSAIADAKASKAKSLKVKSSKSKSLKSSDGPMSSPTMGKSGKAAGHHGDDGGLMSAPHLGVHQSLSYHGKSVKGDKGAKSAKSAKHVKPKSLKYSHSMSAAYETTVDVYAKVIKTTKSHSVKSKQAKVVVEMPDAKASKALHAYALKSLSVSKSAKHVEAKSAKVTFLGVTAQSMSAAYETTADYHAKVHKNGSADDGRKKSKQAKVIEDMPDVKASKAHEKESKSSKSKVVKLMSHGMSSPLGKSSKRSKRSKAKSKGGKRPSHKSTAGGLAVSPDDDGWRSPDASPGYKLFAKHDKRLQESRSRHHNLTALSELHISLLLASRSALAFLMEGVGSKASSPPSASSASDNPRFSSAPSPSHPGGGRGTSPRASPGPRPSPPSRRGSRPRRRGSRPSGGGGTPPTGAADRTGRCSKTAVSGVGHDGAAFQRAATAVPPQRELHVREVVL
ncbi:hypothetical protein THAOC_20604, partial [Thalassiosira oceanica]